MSPTAPPRLEGTRRTRGSLDGHVDSAQFGLTPPPIENIIAFDFYKYQG